MDNNKIYKVLFKGKILPGFDKEAVIENVYKITRIPKDVIKRKFFSGKTVVIRRADSQEYAGRLQKTFAQAGIETYIDEIIETVNNNNEENTLTSEEIDWEPQQAVQDTTQKDDTQPKPVSKPQPKTTTKKFAIIGTAAFVLAVIFVYFLLSSPEPDTMQTSRNQVADIKGPVTTPTPRPFFRAKQINGLIKITDPVELSRLQRFLPLFNINSEYFAALRQYLNLDDSISNTNPLYIFMSNEHKGILFNSKSELDITSLKQLQVQLDVITSKNQIEPNCVKSDAFNVYLTKQSILLSSFHLNKADHTTHGHLIKDISDALIKLAHLFVPSQDKDRATFNFYYHDHIFSDPAIAAQGKQSFNKKLLLLSANDKKYWFTPTTNLHQSATNLLTHLGINPKQPQVVSSLPTKDLYDLSLLLINQPLYKPLSENDSTSDFVQEKSISIKPSFKSSDIKNYEKNLDIEFNPQWQSGPFAIVTNNYQFNKNLKIELLAKGQNIANLMEYSQKARLTIQGVYNNKKENILLNDCKTVSESYFRDSDGEQEAYIDDDFVTFHATTTTKMINIKPGNLIEDVSEIAGEIQLNLPGKILHKALDNPKQINFNRFEHFTIVTKIDKKDRINVQLLGDKDYFLTLRAYNQAGVTLETVNLTAFRPNNGTLHQYQQTFAGPIHSIKIFYTNKKESLTYPFTLKPDIIVASRPLRVDDSEPEPFNGSSWNQNDLGNNLLTDNPHWLGKRISAINLSPFYVSIFLQQGLPSELPSGNNVAASKKPVASNKRDAVINIKTAINPLISQNLTAVKVTLKDGSTTLLNDYISFTEKEFFSDNSDILKPEVYYNSNSAFQFVPTDKKTIHGILDLSLPTEFKSHTSKFLSPGQVIKIGDILLRPIKVSRQQVQFEIKGNIDNLVQVRLYNSANKIISEALEMKRLQKNKALLTLLYNDKVETIKLIFAQSTSKKEYPFSFLVP